MDHADLIEALDGLLDAMEEVRDRMPRDVRDALRSGQLPPQSEHSRTLTRQRLGSDWDYRVAVA